MGCLFLSICLCFFGRFVSQERNNYLCYSRSPTTLFSLFSLFSMGGFRDRNALIIHFIPVVAKIFSFFMFSFFTWAGELGGQAGGLGAGLGTPAGPWPHRAHNKGLPWVPSASALEHFKKSQAKWAGSLSGVKLGSGRGPGAGFGGLGGPRAAHLSAGRARARSSGILYFIYFITIRWSFI